jgi:hypothetical protein
MEFVRKYFQHWRDMTSYHRYDRWCEENYLQLQEEEEKYRANLTTNHTKFINGFHIC